MDPVPEERYRSLLAKAGIRVADPRTGIGAQLTYAAGPRRTIVIHFAKSDPAEYVENAVLKVLSLSDEWLLVPRYGNAMDLGIIERNTSAAAISFNVGERARLATYLCTRPIDHGAHTADLYAISGRGDILVTWDHHTAAEGLCIELLNIINATQLLVLLNEFGAELEVYYGDG
jgi:hypothetical protein